MNPFRRDQYFPAVSRGADGRIKVIGKDGAWAYIEDTYIYRWCLIGRYAASRLSSGEIHLVTD